MSTDAEQLERKRILRMAFGIAVALAASQALSLPGSFITPVLVSMLLCLPIAAPGIKAAAIFLMIFAGAFAMGLLLLPTLVFQPITGLILIVLLVFHCFYFGARGGAPAMVTFLLMGLTVIPVIGVESVDGAILACQGILVSAVLAFLFVWCAYAVFPEPRGEARQKAPQPDIDAGLAAYSALRSTLILVPVFLWLLMRPETSGFAIVLLKVATMGQQASLEDARRAGNDLIASTVIGGIAAVIIWNVLQIWPNVWIYSLLFFVCGLIMGPKIFSGAGLASRGPVWSYGLLTMMIVLAPAALDSGSAAAGRFTDRLVMFLLTTLYAVFAVRVFDSLFPARPSTDKAALI